MTQVFRLLCVWGALVALISVGPVCGQEKNELTVMTFNLRYASAQPPNSWPERRPVMRELILQYHPDVLGTQEGVYEQVKDLATDLGDYAWIGTGRDGGSRGEFMAIFYRKERLEPLEFDHFWLSDKPLEIGSSTWGNSNRRMVTWVKFRDRARQQDFYFFSTHFDHQIQAAREKSAELVWQKVANLPERLAVVLVGDFNAVANHNRAYYTLVAEDRFRDTWLTAKEHGPEINTFHNYRGASEGAGRIDWILTRGPVECLRTEIITFEKDNQYPSDHFPVLARLRLGV